MYHMYFYGTLAYWVRFHLVAQYGFPWVVSFGHCDKIKTWIKSITNYYLASYLNTSLYYGTGTK